MMERFFSLIGILLVGFSSTVFAQQDAAIYQDMIIVQERAKDKEDSFLFNPQFSTEFSDGPESIYALSLKMGYAIKNEWEVYLDLVPAFVTQDRQVKKSVSDLSLLNGQKASIVTPKRKFQYGIEVMWLPAYGKDSWGSNYILRSDTFFKFDAGIIQYEGNTSGYRVALGVGKTFYISPNLNPRLSAAVGSQEIVIDGKKASAQMGLFELGNVWYF